MKRSFVASAALLALLTAGAAWARGWTPVVDTYGSSRAQYLGRDLEECRVLAQAAGGDAVGQGARGAVRGGLVGAAAGGVTRGVGSANQSEAQFRQAYTNCLRNRGHRVLN